MVRSKTYRLATAHIQRKHPELTGADLDEAVDELVQDWLAESARDRELFGDPDDTFSLQDGVHNCNDWGTGEGQFHGRI